VTRGTFEPFDAPGVSQGLVELVPSRCVFSVPSLEFADLRSRNIRRPRGTRSWKRGL
jgi:hypothetical protein